MKCHKRRKRILKYTNETARKWDDVVYLIMVFDVSFLMLGSIFLGMTLEPYRNFINSLGWWYIIIISIPALLFIIVSIFTRKYKYTELTNWY